jgi:hypothetical protein
MLSVSLKVRPGVTIDIDALKLTAMQQIKLALNGSAYLGMMQPEGYTGKVAIYIVHCLEHGYYLDLKHGFEPNTHFSYNKCLSKTKHPSEGKHRVERCRVFSFSNTPSNSLFSLALHPTNQTNHLGA